MKTRPITIIAVSTAAALSAVLFAAACRQTGQGNWLDPDKQHFDAALDYSIAPGAIHIGPSAVTCCIESYGNGAAFYLVNPVPGGTDRRGNPKPPQGELHLATPYGVDYTLGQDVPAFGYMFSFDGTTAYYTSGVKDGTFALNAIGIKLPELKQPTPKVVIPSGLTDDPLGLQGFYTPTGAYFIVGATAPGVGKTPDLHVVSVAGAEDVMQLGNGAFSYYELVTGNDSMIYTDSTASRTPGVPSVQGLYILNLQAGITGAPGVLIDTHIAQPGLTADGTTLVYLRENGELVLWDLRDQDYTTLATDVVSFNLGPGRRGPFVWVKKDLSVHVAFKQRPELLSLPAGSIDLQSPIVFSSDRQHLYYFKNVNLQSNYGDLYHLELPPTGNGQPNLVAVRASLADFNFTNGRLLYVRNVSNTGDVGDLVSANYDGSDPQPMAPGVATGEVQIAYPRPYQPPPGKKGGLYPGNTPPDLSQVMIPPVFANLTGATRDTSTNLQFVNTNARPVIGALAYGPELGKPELLVNPAVHAGQYQFSDDGYVLLYVGDATYQASAFNYVGTLHLFQTNNNVGPNLPMLNGVSEMSPIVDRSVWVAAPGADNPGTYFVKY